MRECFPGRLPAERFSDRGLSSAGPGGFSRCEEAGRREGGVPSPRGALRRALDFTVTEQAEAAHADGAMPAT